MPNKHLLSLLSLTILTTTTISARVPYAPFTIPYLLIANSPGLNPTLTPSYQLTFSIQDPKPTANVLATCTATWDALASNYPTQYTPCSDAPGSEGKGAEFSWFFDHFDGIGEFGLKIRHAYMDER
jgi:hypothetical protein